MERFLNYFFLLFSSLMQEKNFIYYILLSFVFSLLAAWLSAYLRIKKKFKTAYTRKIFHVCIFSVASFLQMKFGLGAVLIFGSMVSLIVLYAVYKGHGYSFFEAMARESDYPRPRLFIVLPLFTTALGGLVSNLLFGHIAFVGYLVGGWGDAVGEPVGAICGKNTYKVPSLMGVPAKRSIQGSLAVFIVSCFAAFVALSFTGLDFYYRIYVGILCGLCAALVEAISTHGLDNFTIQIAASAVAYAFVQ